MANKITVMTDNHNHNIASTLRALLIPLYKKLDFSEFKDYEMVQPKEGFPYPHFFQHVNGEMALDFYRKSGYDVGVLRCERAYGETPCLNEEIVLSQNIRNLGRIIIDNPETFHEYPDNDGRLKQFFRGTDIIFALYPGVVDAWIRRNPTQERGRELERKLGVQVSARDIWSADPSNGYDYSGFFMLNPLSSFTGCYP